MLQLLENGYDVVIMDNLRNSFPKAFEHMQRIAGDKADRMKFVKVGCGCQGIAVRSCSPCFLASSSGCLPRPVNLARASWVL